MNEKINNNEEYLNPICLTVEGCSVKLNFSSKPEKRAIEDVKHIILNNMSKVRK